MTRERIIECDLCLSRIRGRFNWNLSLNYAGYGDFYNIQICRDCLKTKFNIDQNRIGFFETLSEFLREHKLRKYGFEMWESSYLKLLCKLLSDREIPVKDYGIPLFTLDTRTDRGFFSKKIYLHKIINKKV